MIAPLRDLHLFADGREIALGCRMALLAQETLTLRPAQHHLEIHDLSASSAALLSESRNLEVRSGHSILAFGEPAEVVTCLRSGRRLTSVVFSFGLSLWQSSISLSVSAGMKVSDTIRAILSAAVPGAAARAPDTSAAPTATSVPAIPLAAYTARDPVLTRPQAFFGRTCDALTLLAETADADIFLSSAGLCVSGKEERTPALFIPENTLLSEPVRTGDRLLLTTSVLGWPLGARARTELKGTELSGRPVSRLIQADNGDGPWKSELELEV